MKIIKPSFTIETEIDGIKILKHIEKAGRTCYKSDGLITEDSYKKFIKKIMDNEHQSVLEHFSITVRIVCDRGVSHELVRHRLASFSQESTRYCNYSKDKFDNEITFIEPCFWEKDSRQMLDWAVAMKVSENAYLELLRQGATPQEARSVLPNSLKTEIVISANVREWIHILKLRTDKSAHPQMRQIMIPLLEEFQKQIPILFDNINKKEYHINDILEIK
jgi:thymidylate synthase (FAD)